LLRQAAVIEVPPPHLPLPENIRSVQPGGGVCYNLELAWGQWRRRYLKRFRRGYVARMAALRQGDAAGAPHEILDPRDLKYCANQCTASWAPQDDPFRWRERIPFARWGLAEQLLMGSPLVVLLLLLIAAGSPWTYLAAAPAVVLGLVAYFFRDPRREIPVDADAIVSPADGVIAEIANVDQDDFLNGPAVRIGIFLSIFNVHINRAPRAAHGVALRYKPGEFLNALNPESVIRNEYMWIGLEDAQRPGVRFAVRQISGLLARRIVCVLRPGQSVGRGEKFGMIKLGSRTELVLPQGGAHVDVAVGQPVKAGSTVLARFV
jgi:phosphatidylserine decarboxylase